MIFDEKAKLGLLALADDCRQLAIAQLGVKAKKGIDELERKGHLDPGLKPSAYQAVVCRALADTLVAYTIAAGTTEQERKDCLRSSLQIFLGHPDIAREVGRVYRASLVDRVKDKFRGE